MSKAIRQAAERYVKDQVQTFSKRVPQKDVQKAIRKVAEALEEIQAACTEAQRSGLNLK